MAKVKDLNLLLELGQKDLRRAQLSTCERYVNELIFIIFHNLKQRTFDVQMPDLLRYQTGIREVVTVLKEVKDGKKTQGLRFQMQGEMGLYTLNGFIYCDMNYPMDEKEFIGKLLIFNEVKKALDRKDERHKNYEPNSLELFDYCNQCGNLYAIKTKKSRFCTKMCHVTHRKATTHSILFPFKEQV